MKRASNRALQGQNFTVRRKQPTPGGRGWCGRVGLRHPIQSPPNFTLRNSMLIDQIKGYLVETAGVDSQIFDNPELKVADLNLDSLGLVEMLFEIEDKYGFQIPDPMVFLPMTFAEMVAAIDAMVQAQGKAPAPTAA